MLDAEWNGHRRAKDLVATPAEVSGFKCFAVFIELGGFSNLFYPSQVHVHVCGQEMMGNPTWTRCSLLPYFLLDFSGVRK